MFLKKFLNVNNSDNFYTNIRKFIFVSKSPIIETNHLYKLLTDEKLNLNNLKIIDCTLFNDKISDDEKIPNSIFINPMDLSENKYIKTITKESLDELEVVNPYNIPSNEDFIKKMKIHNIKKSDSIICYDRFGIYSSARLWFILKLFGLKNVYVLNGGFNKWKKDKFPIEKNKAKASKINMSKNNSLNESNKEVLFSYKKDESKILNTNNMLYHAYDIIKRQSKDEIVDTRSPERYNAEIDEPFPVLRKGTMKSCINLHYKNLFDENSCLVNEAKIKEIFNHHGVDFDIFQKFVVFSGLGISSCIFILSCDVIGKYDRVKFYSGGWFEMGNVQINGNLILQQINKFEETNSLDETDKIFSQMGPEFHIKYNKRMDHQNKILDIKEKNFEYLKNKNKRKQKEEGDYSSPDEMF